MNKVGYFIGQFIAWLIILGIVLLFAFGIYHLLDIVNWIVQVFKSLGRLDAVIIVAIIGALATFIANLFSKQSDHKFELRKYLSNKREESYEDFLKIFFELMEENTSDTKIKEKVDIPERLSKFKQTLLLYSSKRTYKAFVKYWKSITETDDLDLQMKLMQKVVSEMRRDAGAGLIKNDIISNIIVNKSK